MSTATRNHLVHALRAALAAAALALPLAACVVYEPAPYAQASSFDRSWGAALGAMQDQGVTVRTQDRASGVITGTRGAVSVTANVRTLADGRVRVEFSTTGGAAAEPGLVERISASYDARMGR